MSDFNERYRKAAARGGFDAQQQAALARALTSGGVTVKATPPALPPFEQPGNSLPFANYMKPAVPPQEAPAPAQQQAPFIPTAPVPQPMPTYQANAAAAPAMPAPTQIGPQAPPMLPAHFFPNMTAAQQYDREFAADPDQFGGPGGGRLGRLFRPS